MVQSPRISVVDSGVGGLTVLAEIARLMLGCRITYTADDAGFPYGALSEKALVERVVKVINRIIERDSPDIIVLACNTASTICLSVLRQRFSIPFVGTVPAIKPAASTSRSKHISVLATPGTVAREYTRQLIATHAADCKVTLVGAQKLAGYAEAELAGVPVSDVALLAEIAPAFVEDAGRRTDAIVLACTHYPLLLQRFAKIALWQVEWVDPAPAIARRVASLLGGVKQEGTTRPMSAYFTSGARVTETLQAALYARGIKEIRIEPIQK